MRNTNNSVKAKTLSDFSPFLQSTLLNPVAPVRQEGAPEISNDDDFDDEDLVERMFEGIEEEEDKRNVTPTTTNDTTEEKKIQSVTINTSEEPKATNISNYVKDKPRKTSWLSKLCKCGGDKQKTKPEKKIDLKNVKQSFV